MVRPHACTLLSCSNESEQGVPTARSSNFSGWHYAMPARQHTVTILRVTLFEHHSCCCSLHEHLAGTLGAALTSLDHAYLACRWEFKAKHFDSLLCFKMVSLLDTLLHEQ